jgi:hypothetical protein
MSSGSSQYHPSRAEHDELRRRIVRLENIVRELQQRLADVEARPLGGAQLYTPGVP